MRVFRPDRSPSTSHRAIGAATTLRVGVSATLALAMGAAGIAASGSALAATPRAAAHTSVLGSPPWLHPGATTRAALSPDLVAKRGASVGFSEQEAEHATTNATVIGPAREAYDLPAEASGRSAVKLTAPGQWVEFTAPRFTNGLTIRYALPDTATGGGVTAPIDILVDGHQRQSVTLTSQFSWLYGMYPFSNDPDVDPNPGWWKPEPDPVPKPFRPTHFFNEQRVLLSGWPVLPGQKIRLALPVGSTVAYAAIDLLDTEWVSPAAHRPRGWVSVTDFGADTTGATDAAGAFDAAIAAAKTRNKKVFIPAGTYQINRHIVVDDVTLKGAGSWWTKLTGDGVGVYGKYVADGGSTDVHLSNFAILGNVRDRQDELQLNGVGGALGGGSTVEGLYIRHTKVGIWLDGPFSGLTVRNNIIVDQIADGLNLHLGVSNVRVTNNFIRNTGDDGLAMWSENGSGDVAANEDHNNIFDHNTVQSPTLANGIAIYGGRDNWVTDNLVADPVREGSALHAGSRFNATPFAGTLTFARNTTVRGGIRDLNWNLGIGAIWFFALEKSIDANIQVTDSSFLDSTYDAIMFVSDWPVKDLYSITNVHFSDIKVDGTGTSVVNARAAGWADFTNVDARNVGAAGVNNCGTFHFTGVSEFEVRNLGGNDVWLSTTTCDDRPPRVAPPAPSPWN